MKPGQSTPASKTPRIIAFAMILVAIVFLFPEWGLLQTSANSRPNASSNGEKIPGSQYSLFQGQVYVSSWGNGSYVLPGADVSSFKPIENGHGYGYALGRDAHAVYCGNRVIEGLRPEAVSKAFGGYIDDGNRAWFCGRPVDNPDYHGWQEFLLSDKESDPGRVKHKQFPLVAIEQIDVAALHPVFDEYVSDDRHLFYQGKLIAGSDGLSGQPLTYQSNIEREALDYLRDARAVYYKGEALIGVKPEHFSVFDVEGGEPMYGLDTASGAYWLEGKKFPDTADGVDARGLRILLADRTHAYHDLFANSQGVFFWDTAEGGLRHACTFPSAQRLQAVKGLPSVFQDGQSLYVVSAQEVWRQSRNGRRLTSRHTRLYRLVGVSPDDLRHTGEVSNARGGKIGDLWQAGTQILFEPQAGTGHGYDDALYLVSDLQKFQSAALSPDYLSISTLQRESALEPVAGDKVCDAETESNSLWRYVWFPIAGLVTASLLANILRRRKGSKDIKR